MNNLRHTLVNMQQLLDELRIILLEEWSQLRRPQVNPVALQLLSDNKSRRLSALAFFDQQRQSQEKALALAAPYAQHNDLNALWQNIAATVHLTKERNLAIYPLIELQMKKAAALNTLAKKARAGAALYSADGRTQNGLKGTAYNITI